MPNTTNIQIALSIRQPWAWLIIRPDLTDDSSRSYALVNNLFKDIENRTWQTKYTGPLLIHAAKGFTWEEYCAAQEFLILQDIPIVLPEFQSFQLGGIIGKAKMLQCVDQSKSRWFTGPYGFQLTSPEILPFQPFRGQLNFFQVSM